VDEEGSVRGGVASFVAPRRLVFFAGALGTTVIRVWAIADCWRESGGERGGSPKKLVEGIMGAGDEGGEQSSSEDNVIIAEVDLETG
jgi:hypothetical protein